ncbi:roquin-1-like [Watersipora subatra]|uniref:roquin-1-like n=1 Tax=Watersipora subatra TaxID=2589382 RepID=UPI00355B04E5
MARHTVWTEFGSCLHCKQDFDAEVHLPISLECSHTLCRPCLTRLHADSRPCPVDSKDKITPDMLNFPPNSALLVAAGTREVNGFEKLVEATKRCFALESERNSFVECSRILEKFGGYLKCATVNAGLTGPLHTKEMSSCAYINTSGGVTLSRPMQKKLLSLVTCQLITSSGRERFGRCVKSLGERCITEMILQHQPHQLGGNLWGAVRSRGCQFLGPAMQEEVIRLILMALEDGSALSRKVLVLFVVQRLHEKYPQASKTAIGHVVQLLYRASCFKVMKRENESSLMQLKEEYCTYDQLRIEHDKQIIQIAHEAGLRIAPDQWSSLLYGDMHHKPKMQSIIDKIQTPQSFKQSISEFLIAVGRTNNPANLTSLKESLLRIAELTEAGPITIEICLSSLQSIDKVIEALVHFVEDHCRDKLSFIQPSQTSQKHRSIGEGDFVDFPKAAGQEEWEQNREAVDLIKTGRKPELLSCYKPRAVVSPTTRNRAPSEVHWQAHSSRPVQQPITDYYPPPSGPAGEVPPAEFVMSPQMRETHSGYYQQISPSPAMLPRHPQQAMHMIPSSPLSPSGYMTVRRNDVALVPANHYQSYYSPQSLNYYYEQPVQYSSPHSPRSYYTPPMNEEAFYDSNRQVYAPVYPPVNPSVYCHSPLESDGIARSTRPPSYYQEVNNMTPTMPHSHTPMERSPADTAMVDDSDSIDQENLYEYQSRPSDRTLQTLASLRRRRDELLDKIQSHQQPADMDAAVKTEISRDRIEDLARSLAVSMNVGGQEADLKATFVNSMLSAANMAPVSSEHSLIKKSDNGNHWGLLSPAPHASSYETPKESRSCSLFNSLTSSSAAVYPQATVTRSETDIPVWTSLSGLTSGVGQVMKEWTGLRRSMSEKESDSYPAHPVSKFTRSLSQSAMESEPIVPWSDKPLISMFGPISRSSSSSLHPTSKTARIDSLLMNQPPISAELNTEVKDKQPIQVSAQNNLTMTAVTPVKRPIPSPSLAHSKFTPLLDERHGFTLTNADMEGSSSIAESEQLRQELKIVDTKIGRVEDEAAREELTDIERMIKGLENGSSLN